MGPYDLVSAPAKAYKHMHELGRQLVGRQHDLGIVVECYRDQVCLVRLASEARGVVLDALALRLFMKELLQPLLADRQVHKVFCGHVNNMAWLSSNDGIIVNKPIFDTATVAQAID